MDTKILLVDDAAFMRMLIKDTLTKNGYTNILEAADGAIACEVYAAEKPDLVIMDITMPNKTGIEALKEIKGSDPMARLLCVPLWDRKQWLLRLLNWALWTSSLSPSSPTEFFRPLKKSSADLPKYLKAGEENPAF